MTNELPGVPPELYARVRGYLAVRMALDLAGAFLLALATTGLIGWLALGVDRLLLLGPGWRQLLQVAIALPLPLWGLWTAVALWRLRASDQDLRRLDNATDDLRAALNLVARLRAGDGSLNPDLVAATVVRSRAVALAPWPSLAGRWRLLAWRAGLCGLIGGGLWAYRSYVPDVHTAVSRLVAVHDDFGTIGRRKFMLKAEVWTNAAITPPGAPAAPLPARTATVYFLREYRKQGTWQVVLPGPRTWADRLAGDFPLAVVNRRISLLAGDRLRLRASVVALPDPLAGTGYRDSVADLEYLRTEGAREVRVPHHELETTAFIELDKVQRSHPFRLRAGRDASPRYQVAVTPRPTPERIWLFRQQPSQYGQGLTETVIRDAASGTDVSRISGLPGAVLALEFITPYGEDLDSRQSWVQVGANRREKVRWGSSRNAERRARGEKAWSCSFTLDTSIEADAKLYFHLVTARARFNGAPIANDYDEPLLIHRLPDLPPTIEFTTLPEERLLRCDDLFPLRFRYRDDYGIASVALSDRDHPYLTQHRETPIELRPPATPGELRQEDEMLYIVDLSQHQYGFVEFLLLVTDVNNQEAETPELRLTMADPALETVLPRLTGGWYASGFTWDQAPPGRSVQGGDLDAAPDGPRFAQFQANLARLAPLLAGADVKRADVQAAAGALNYHHATMLFTSFPRDEWGYYHRDYPYYFQRQAGSYLTGLAAFDSAVYAPLGTWLSHLPADRPPDPARLAAWREFTTEQAELAALVQATRSEIYLRAGLLRIAHFCETVNHRLAEADQLLSALQPVGGPLPAAELVGDLWQVYPAWVMTRHHDYNVRQQARLVSLKIRNVNYKQAELRNELGKVLALPNQEDLDPRLRAMMAQVAGLGNTVFGADRAELAAKTRLLARFIRQGILAAEQDVYREMVNEFPGCAARARNAAAKLPEAETFLPRMSALLQAAEALVRADLPHHAGHPVFPADRSARWQENQRSRFQSELDLLDRHAQSIAYGQDLHRFDDPTLLRAALSQFSDRARATRTGAEQWPELRRYEAQLAQAEAAATAFAACLAAVQVVQRELGILGGMRPLFAETGFPEVTDRQLIAGLDAALATCGARASFARERRESYDREARGAATLPAAQQAADQAAATKARLDQELAAATAAAAAAERRLGELVTQETELKKNQKANAQALAKVRRELADLRAEQPKRSKEMSTLKAQAAAAQQAADRTAAKVRELVATGPAERTAREQHLKELQESLPTAEAGFARLAALPVWTTAAGRTPARAPHPRLTAATSRLFEALSPVAVLSRLDADVKRFADDPAMIDALFAAATAYFMEVPVVTAKDVLGNPVEEYLRGRAAAAFYVSSPENMAPLARHFGAAPDTLPAAAAPLFKPYLEAQPAGRLADFLRAQRRQRLAEVLALAQRLQPLQHRYEALQRIQSLTALLDELDENVRLLRGPPGDARNVTLWSAIQEEIEGLQADVLAGRLPDLPATFRQELSRNVVAFRCGSATEAFASPEHRQEYVACQAALRAAEGVLLSAGLEPGRVLAADTRVLQQDLALVVLDVSADLAAKERQLPAPVHGTEFHKSLKLAAYAWRGACLFRAMSYAGAPDDAGREAVLNDFAMLIALKLLPEYFRFGGKLDKVQPGLNLILNHFVRPGPASGLPSRNDVYTDLLVLLSSSSPVIFGVEEDFASWQEQWRQLVSATAPAMVSKGIDRVRLNPLAQGQFWRVFAQPLADYLEVGQVLADAEFCARLTPAQVRAHLVLLGTHLTRARQQLEVLGQGLPPRDKSELAVLDEAEALNQQWLAALDAQDRAATEAQQVAYRDVYDGVVSYVKSAQGNLFPPEPSYQPRPIYSRGTLYAYSGDLALAAAEERWWLRADRERALACRALVSEARDRLAGQPPAPQVPAQAWVRFLDVKYRYLMAFCPPATAIPRLPLVMREVDQTIPEHLGRALVQALSIELPDQDNRPVRKAYLEAIQEDQQNSTPF